MKQEAETVIIPVPGGKASFTGRLAKEVSSRIDEEDERQERFTVIRVFEVAGNSVPGYEWVISSIGRSVRYHALDSPCNLGTAVTVAWLQDLPYYDKLVECRVCTAPDVDDLELTDRVRYEMDRVNPVITCRTPADVRRRLHERRQEVTYKFDPRLQRQVRYTNHIEYLSAPAEKLLYALAEDYPAFAALLNEALPLVGEAESGAA